MMVLEKRHVARNMRSFKWVGRCGMEPDNIMIHVPMKTFRNRCVNFGFSHSSTPFVGALQIEIEMFGKSL